MENLETKEDQKSKYRAEENKLNLFNSMPESSRVVDDCDDAKNGDAKPDIKLTNEDYIAISVGAIVIFIIVVIILCIGLSSNGELSEKQKLAMLKVQDDTYVLFEDNVYKKVDGNDYYTDIIYMCDVYERELNRIIDSNVVIRIDEVHDGIYSSSWICSVEFNRTVYPLFMMTVDFDSYMMASRKSMSKIPLDK